MEGSSSDAVCDSLEGPRGMNDPLQRPRGRRKAADQVREKIGVTDVSLDDLDRRAESLQRATDVGSAVRRGHARGGGAPRRSPVRRAAVSRPGDDDVARPLVCEPEGGPQPEPVGVPSHEV